MNMKEFISFFGDSRPASESGGTRRHATTRVQEDRGPDARKQESKRTGARNVRKKTSSG